MLLVNRVLLSQCYSIDEMKNTQGCILQHGNARAQIVQALEAGEAMSQGLIIMTIVCIG